MGLHEVIHENPCCESGCKEMACTIITTHNWVGTTEMVTQQKAYCYRHDPHGAHQRNQQLVYRMAEDMNCHDTYWPHLSYGERERRRDVIRDMAYRLGVKSPTFF